MSTVPDTLSSPTAKDGCKRMVVVTSLCVGGSYQDLNWFMWAVVNTVISSLLSDKNIQETHPTNLTGRS